MTRRVRKSKIKLGRLIIAIILLIVVIILLLKFLNFETQSIITKEYYVASDNNVVPLYSYDEENEKMNETSQIYRGQKIETNMKDLLVNEINYIKFNKGEVSYYIDEKYLTENKNDVIREKKKYVRTSCTIYKNENDSKIASFIKKGSALEITGYDFYNDEGIVNMYKISSDAKEGWVYAKYLVDTEEESNANYNENSRYS